MEIEKAKDWAIRFLCWVNAMENADKAELNDLEIAKDELLNEFETLQD